MEKIKRPAQAQAVGSTIQYGKSKTEIPANSTYVCETATPYVMGHTNPERRRLALQASILRPFTERLLREAGIAWGMHVLDIGCGVGDVSMLAAGLVGRNGSVTSVDVDPGALETL
ncbi:MAG: methyltransferase domain-containing protein, partial [Bryobacteraceae bacterium]